MRNGISFNSNSSNSEPILSVQIQCLIDFSFYSYFVRISVHSKWFDICNAMHIVFLAAHKFAWFILLSSFARSHKKKSKTLAHWFICDRWILSRSTFADLFFLFFSLSLFVHSCPDKKKIWLSFLCVSNFWFSLIDSVAVSLKRMKKKKTKRNRNEFKGRERMSINVKFVWLLIQKSMHCRCVWVRIFILIGMFCN